MKLSRTNSQNVALENVVQLFADYDSQQFAPKMYVHHY